MAGSGLPQVGYLLLWHAGLRWITPTNHMLIGAADECTLCILDEHVSRKHCEICVDGESVCWIRDCSSTNGTYVNGIRILSNQIVRLTNGDIIDLLGGVTFLVVSCPLENIKKLVAT
jgi:S-DNA-T family DNA segregation ATPase FtsK/SpoIIIE